MPRNGKMNNLNKIWKFSFFCFLSSLIVSCGGGGTNTTADAGNCAFTPGQPSSSTYTISWDTVTNADLKDYTLYYGTNSSLNKFNATGTIKAIKNNNVTFNPATHGITTCTQAYIAISSLGNTISESALSNVKTFVVE